MTEILLLIICVLLFVRVVQSSQWAQHNIRQARIMLKRKLAGIKRGKRGDG